MPPISILVALADPTRCRILEILRDGPQPVHVLSGAFSISRPAISRHLRVLKTAKLIKEKKTGRENVYRLQVEKLRPVQDWLVEMQPTPVPDAAPEPVSTVHALVPPKRDIARKRPAASKTPAAPQPVAPVEIPAPPKPVSAAAISQMGFDF